MIRVLGIGPGAKEYVTPAVWEKAGEADLLVGAKRALELFLSLKKETRLLSADYDREIAFLKQNQDSNVAVLVTGDPGFFSFLGVLRRHFSDDELEVTPGISSAQLFMAKIGRSWEDVYFYSLHGRSAVNFIETVKAHRKVCALLDGTNTPDAVARMLLENGIASRTFVASKLSYPDETVREVELEALATERGEGGAIMYLEIEEMKSERSAIGEFYGIGIGPGDPELITVKGRRLLEEADVVVAPKAEITGESFAHSIIGRFTDPSKVVELVFPMTKDKKVLGEHWGKAADEVGLHLAAGKKVVFITIGDPMLYSTFIYLLRGVKERFPEAKIEVVPGISTPSAMASALGQPLVEGKEKLAVICTPDNVLELDRYLRSFDTLVLMKVGKRLPKLIEFLEEKEMLGDAVLVSRLGTERERIVYDLKSVEGEPEVGYLSTVMITKKLENRAIALSGARAEEV